ncbi:MAG: glycosyltransferase family 2 protein [Gemmatimonadota bacterium]
MSYALLIPARDEAEALPLLFDRLGRVADAPARIVVVDNGSTDDTAGVARDLGAEVVTEPRPGYGQACLAGIAHLRRQGATPDALVFLDADDFAAPAQLAVLLGPIETDAADLVVGERTSPDERGVRWHARLGNAFVVSVMRVRYGSTVRDMGPFRAIRWRSLALLGLDDRDYGWYVQMQVRALRAGLRVTGVTVEFERRSVGTSKVSGNPFASARAGWVMLRTLAVEVLRRGAPGQPRADSNN